MDATKRANEAAASLIVTVRDDREGVVELLHALEAQTDTPDEIVVVDGGSSDGTLEELGRWAERMSTLRVIIAPDANIGAGRNIAVRMARFDWIVCTDAGCRPVRDWFETLRHARTHADIVAGTFVVEGDSVFERALACAHYPDLDEIHDASTAVHLSHTLFGRDFRAVHAGGRSMAFTREAWQAVGGFPEHIYAGEDLAFSAAVIERGFRPRLVEDAIVRWRPRGSAFDNARMFATYTRGDIRTKPRSRHLARLLAWTFGPALMIRCGARSRLAVALGALAYIWLPMRRVRRSSIPFRNSWLVPALVALKDLSQLFGAGLGIIDALRRVPQPTPANRSTRNDGRHSI